MPLSTADAFSTSFVSRSTIIILLFSTTDEGRVAVLLTPIMNGSPPVNFSFTSAFGVNGMNACFHVNNCNAFTIANPTETSKALSLDRSTICFSLAAAHITRATFFGSSERNSGSNPE